MIKAKQRLNNNSFFKQSNSAPFRLNSPPTKLPPPAVVSGSSHKFVVNRVDGLFEVAVVDADDDGKLAGALVNHTDVDTRAAHGAEKPGSGAAVVHHTPSDRGDDGQIVADRDTAAVFYQFFDFGQNL